MNSLCTMANVHKNAQLLNQFVEYLFENEISPPTNFSYLRLRSDLVWWIELKFHTLNKAYHKFIKFHWRNYDKWLGRKHEQTKPFIKNLNVHLKNFKGKPAIQKLSILFLLREHNLDLKLYKSFIYDGIIMSS